MRVNTNKYIIYNNYAEIVTKHNQSILIDIEDLNRCKTMVLSNNSK